MANPQLENGHTRIANEILDALIAANLSGHEFRIALLIIRKTYGFQKCEDTVSLSQMMKATGFKKIRCSQVINKLQLQNIVTVTENCNGLYKKYKFNKDLDVWAIPLQKSVTVTEKRYRPLQKSVTTKETITKERKDIVPHTQIIDLYHQELTSMPKIKSWTPSRQSLLRTTWNGNPEYQTLEAWQKLFTDIREHMPFLQGQSSNGHKPFYADLEWIVKPSNFIKIIEGKYKEKSKPTKGFYDNWPQQ